MIKEYLEVPFEVKKVSEENDNFVFEGLASTFGNKDLVDDIVVKGAFVDSLKQRTPVILWQHDTREPIGMPESVRETSAGLEIRGLLPKDDSFVSGRVIPQMKIGSVQTMSIGYSVKDYNIKDGVRFLKSLELHEVSLVTFPANPMAKVSGFKGVAPFHDFPLCSTSQTWIEAEAVQRIKSWAGCDSTPNAKFASAFLWHDKENADSFSSYKMPVVDVIDGELQVIQAALNKASFSLKNLSGQSEEIKENSVGIESLISKHKERFNSKSIYPTNAAVYTLDNVIDIKTRKQLNEFLKGIGIFSRKAREHISALIKSQGAQGNPDPLEPLSNSEAKELLSLLNKNIRGFNDGLKRDQEPS